MPATANEYIAAQWQKIIDSMVFDDLMRGAWAEQQSRDDLSRKQKEKVMSEDSDLPNLGTLIKCLKQTTNDNDNVALVAIRAANKQLEKFGGDWEKLLRGKVTVIGDPFEGVNAPPKVSHPARPMDQPGAARRSTYTPPPGAYSPRPTPAPKPAPPPPTPKMPLVDIAHLLAKAAKLPATNKQRAWLQDIEQSLHNGRTINAKSLDFLQNFCSRGVTPNVGSIMGSPSLDQL